MMAALTAESVKTIAGVRDEGRIIEILKTGATEAELVEALEWLSADDAMAHERHHGPDSRVAELHDILSRNEIEHDEDRME